LHFTSKKRNEMKTSTKPEAVATRNADGSYNYRGTVIAKEANDWGGTYWVARINGTRISCCVRLQDAKVDVDRTPPQAAIDHINSGGDFDAYFYDEEEAIVWGVFNDGKGNLIEWYAGEIEEYGCLITTVEDYTARFSVGRSE
jgi:hypothetical protein